MVILQAQESRTKQPSPRRAARRFHAHVPESLDLEMITRPEWKPYGEVVVSLVVIRRFMDHHASEMTYVPLSAGYIRLFIPAKISTELLQDLRDRGVLERDHVYYFGAGSDGRGKCYCYRIGQDYRGIPIRPRPIVHPEVLRKIHHARGAERQRITDPVHRALRSWHDQVEVLPAAPYGEHPLLDRMIEGERRFSVCQQGRVHTNVANLPRQYRHYLRLADRELVAIDIATSQPLLLAIMLSRSQSQSRPGPAAQAICAPCSDSDLSEFLADCRAGMVYDRIAGITGYDRDDVKGLFLAVIYGEPQHMETKVGKAIRDLYPSVFAAAVDLNYSLGHGGLPRRLQRIESGVMIGRVAGRLIREQPAMPLVTVHDSVLVPPEYVELVEDVIAEEWTSEFGFAPLTKRSPFTSPQDPRAPRRRRPPHLKHSVPAHRSNEPRNSTSAFGGASIHERD